LGRGPGLQLGCVISSTIYMPHRALAGCGPPVATENCFFFFSVLIYRTQYYCFLHSFLSKFVISFSTQVIPTKICLENAKITEFFLKSLKFMNFIHVSAANI
jgi:hypothetical protein